MLSDLLVTETSLLACFWYKQVLHCPHRVRLASEICLAGACTGSGALSACPCRLNCANTKLSACLYPATDEYLPAAVFAFCAWLLTA